MCTKVNTLWSRTNINTHFKKGKYKPFILFLKKEIGADRYLSLNKKPDAKKNRGM